MKIIRSFALGILLLGCIATTFCLIQAKAHPPFAKSWEPLFEELGKPVQSFDRALNRVLPISEIDEKHIGDEIKKRFSENSAPFTQEEEKIVNYLNALVQYLTIDSKKPFKYKVFLVKGCPNACALPGGVIIITKSLLELLENEAELAAVLSHEIGHIERGHLFDSVAGKMLRKKSKLISIVGYTTEVINKMGRITFNKAQENEADEYSFRLLVTKGYDPFALVSLFNTLLAHEPKFFHNLFSDFFATHPHIELRKEKFNSLAQLWLANNPHPRVYVGKRNFVEKSAFQHPEEFKVL